MSSDAKTVTWGDIALRIDELHDAYLLGRRDGEKEAHKMAEREASSVAIWQWVRFDGMDGLSDWMPAKKVGKYWASVGWVGLTPEVYGSKLFTPKEPV